jgi:type III pantothenate kinase
MGTELRSPGWLALAIGNSRLHWAAFVGDRLQTVWHTPHLDAVARQQWLDVQFDFRATAAFPEAMGFADRATQAALAQLSPQPPLSIASVVPPQNALWMHYAPAQFITLNQIPLDGLYATFGLDRALTLWGAIATYGSPVLVIDAGTALTFTGAAHPQRLVGGAILPGLRLQLQALGQSTAALPDLSAADVTALPPRWAQDTSNAIASGVLYTLLASLRSFIQDWHHQFPDSAILLTGGDGDRLYAGLQQIDGAIADAISLDPTLIFQGIAALVPKGL